jgi:hypothetical protein
LFKKKTKSEDDFESKANTMPKAKAKDIRRSQVPLKSMTMEQ